jgi:hypothetical protein
MAPSSAPTETDLRRMVETLTPTERGALPARLRRLVADGATRAWWEAKAARDADLEAAYAVEDPDEREAALANAREAWTARKAELKGEG